MRRREISQAAGREEVAAGDIHLTRRSPAPAGLRLVQFRLYLPVPEPGVGPIVDPLGDGLIAVFPDGFSPLFCAAAALPA